MDSSSRYCIYSLSQWKQNELRWNHINIKTWKYSFIRCLWILPEIIQNRVWVEWILGTSDYCHCVIRNSPQCRNKKISIIIVFFFSELIRQTSLFGAHEGHRFNATHSRLFSETDVIAIKWILLQCTLLNRIQMNVYILLLRCSDGRGLKMRRASNNTLRKILSPSEVLTHFVPMVSPLFQLKILNTVTKVQLSLLKWWENISNTTCPLIIPPETP